MIENSKVVMMAKNITFFRLILPLPVKMFGLDPDGHEGPPKNLKLESSLMIYVCYRKITYTQHEKGHTRKQDEHGSKLSGD